MKIHFLRLIDALGAAKMLDDAHTVELGVRREFRSVSVHELFRGLLYALT